MPTAPPRVCARCRQPAQHGKPCTCRPPWQRTTKPNRVGGRRWRRLRTAKLAADPICQHPDCRRPATEVDHITPLAAGGPEFDWSNLSALCASHHAAKTSTETRRR
jgi:hypothetical protein